MANKHSRDFGLNRGPGKGSRPRTDTSSKAFQEGYGAIEWSAPIWPEAYGFKQTGPAKWTKRFK